MNISEILKAAREYEDAQKEFSELCSIVHSQFSDATITVTGIPHGEEDDEEEPVTYTFTLGDTAILKQIRELMAERYKIASDKYQKVLKKYQK